MQLCLQKEIALQSALRYNFALLRSARFSEFKGEKSLPDNAFSTKISNKQKFLTGHCY